MNHGVRFRIGIFYAFTDSMLNPFLSCVGTALHDMLFHRPLDNHFIILPDPLLFSIILSLSCGVLWFGLAPPLKQNY